MKPTSRTRSGWLPLAGIAFAVSFASVAGFYLWTEHRAQLFVLPPFLLLAACPLMHLLMHHGGHSGHKDHSPANPLESHPEDKD